MLVFENNGTFICFVLAVSIMTTVSEREMNPHLDPFVGAFVYLMQWQILLCILAMLLMDAEMTNQAGDMVIGLILMLVNICMALVVFLDTRGDVLREAQEKAAMRAKMVRNSVIGRNLPAHVARRFTARVSLASSMFQKKRKEEEENDEDEWRQDDDGDNEEEEVVAAIEEEEEEEEVVEEDDLYHGYDSQDSADDSIGQLMNPMFRAWGKPSGEAKGGDSAADEASADDASSIEMTTTKERGVAEAKSDDGNTGDSSKSEEDVEVVLEDVQVSALNAEESSSESEEVDIVLGDVELSVDGSAAAANKAVAGVSSETGSLSDHFEIEARLSSDEAPNDLSHEGAKLPVAVDAESSARAGEGSTKEESTRNDRGETPSASGEGSKKKTQDQHDERAQKVHFLKAEFFDSL